MSQTNAARDLENFVSDAFAALKVPRSDAQVVAGLMVQADLRG